MNESENSEVRLTYAEIEQFNKIVEQLYQTRDSDEDIESALMSIKDLIYFDSAFFYILKQEEDNYSFQKMLMPGIERAMYEKYMSDFFSIDDTVSLVSEKRSIVYRTSDLFDLQHRKNTGFYKNFLSPVGIEYSMEENLRLKSTLSFGGLALHRKPSRRDFSEKEMSILVLLRPHLTDLAEHWAEMDDGYSYTKTREPNNIARFNKIAYSFWDENVNLIEENLSSCTFVSESTIILQAIREHLYKLRRLDYPLHERHEYHRIIHSDGRMYYLDITLYPGEETTRGHSVALLYDFNAIFQGIVDYRCEDGTLTRRESEIIRMVLSGMSSQEIANTLHIELSTVKTHLNNIYSKFSIEGKHQLLRAIFDLPSESTT